ncbi:MAG: VTT domain-containing protein [Planctomycetota bacterium]
MAGKPRTPETETVRPPRDAAASASRESLSPEIEAPAEERESPPAGCRSASKRRAVLLLVLAIACLAAVYLTPLRQLFQGERIEALRSEVQQTGAFAPLVFLALTATGVALAVPRLLFAALGGLLFGLVAGALLTQLATLAGCWGTFVAGRFLGREFVADFVSRRFSAAATLLDVIAKHGVMSNVLIRVIPVGNSFAVNLLMSVSPVRTRHFLLGTLLGTLPGTCVFALFGSAVGSPHATLRLTIGAGLFVLLSAASAIAARKAPLTRQIRRGRLSREDSTSPQETVETPR